MNPSISRAGVALCSLLLLASAPRIAAAEPTAAELASARDFMKEGKALRAQGDHAAALKKFLAAYAVVPTPITGLAVAEEQIAVGQLVEARETIGAIAQMPAAPNESDAGKKARADAATLLTDVLPRIPIIEVKVTGVPPGQQPTLTIDGRSVPLAAAEQGFRVNPGKHTVVVSTTGVADETKTVEVKERDRTTVDLAFSTAPTSAADPSVVAAVPGPATTTTDSSAGTPWRTVGLVTAGVGVVTLAAGGVLGLSARSEYNDAKDAHCDASGQCSPEGKRLTDDARSRGTVGTVLFSVGAVIAVGGAVLWFASPGATRTEAAKGITHVGLGPGSLLIGGRF